MLGIPVAHCLSAEGLDIRENDPEAILRGGGGPGRGAGGDAERLREHEICLLEPGAAQSRGPRFFFARPWES